MSDNPEALNRPLTAEGWELVLDVLEGCGTKLDMPRIRADVTRLQALAQQAATPAPAEPVYALLPMLERLRGLTPPDVGSTWEDQYRELEDRIQRLADALAAPPATPAAQQADAAMQQAPERG